MDVNLVLIKKNGPNKIFPLSSDVTVIGRRRDCTLRIPVVTVSKKHCRLYYEDGQMRIRDLGSKNGTLLNGKRVEETVIEPGDNIKIGPLKFVLQIDGHPENPGEDETLPEDVPKKARQTDEPTSETPLESADDILDHLSSSDMENLDLLDDSGEVMDAFESVNE